METGETFAGAGCARVVLFIIDSCYSGTATRKVKDSQERIVGMIALG